MAFGVALTFGVTSAVLFLTKDEAPAATSSTQAAKTAKAAAAKKTAVTFTPTPIVGAHSGGAGFVASVLTARAALTWVRWKGLG